MSINRFDFKKRNNFVNFYKKIAFLILLQYLTRY
jgi:hypothetical protein